MLLFFCTRYECRTHPDAIVQQEFKRKSRDMETETEEELFLAFSNGCETAGSSSNAGSVSVSLSLSDKSLSVDNIEEVVIGDQPYEGKRALGVTLH